MNPNVGKNPTRPALGKGLASLLPNAGNNSALVAKQIMGEVPSAASAPEPVAKSSISVPPPSPIPAVVTPPPVDPAANGKERVPGISMADIDSISTNQFQPRRDFDDASLAELSESIKSNGIIQPLIVRRGEDGKLNLIAGERRLRASKLAGLKQVPVVIRKSSDKEALEVALIENIQREDLNCVDIALSYYQLIEDFHLTQEDVAGRVGKDRASVANHLRLLKLPETIIGDLRSGKLTYGHGRALLSVTDPLKRIELRNKIIENQLSVRETERLVAELMVRPTDKEDKKKEKSEIPELRQFAERLGRALGTRVKSKGDQYRGSIVIDYFSKEDLDRISEQLLR